MRCSVPLKISGRIFQQLNKFVDQQGLVPQGMKLLSTIYVQFESDDGARSATNEKPAKSAVRRREPRILNLPSSTPLKLDPLVSSGPTCNPYALVEETGVPVGVHNALIDSLCVDPEEIRRETTIIVDLGAESIDYVDIVYKLERTFGVEISRIDLFPEDILTNADYISNGRLNAQGMEALKKRMPFANLAAFEEIPTSSFLAELITVDFLIRYLKSKGVEFEEAPQVV